MLSEHLKRTVRISKPITPITPKRKGTHWIIYVFLGLVLIIILGLLLITYDC